MSKPLSNAQLTQFEELGFAVVPAVFDLSELATIDAALSRLEQSARALPQSQLHRGSEFVISRDGPHPDEVRIHRIVWCGAAEPDLSRLGKKGLLVEMAAQVLGSPVIEQLINQVHFKFPGDGVAFPWHQDSNHRRYGTPLWTDINGRGSFVEIAVAVDPMTAENGGLRFIPGSHRGGHIEVGQDRRLPKQAVDETLAVTLELPPGSAVLFGPYVIHGSLPNLSRQPRRTFLNGFAFPGANRRIYPGEGAGRTIRLSDYDHAA